jgi:exosortase/archaeosortase family protein
MTACTATPGCTSEAWRVPISGDLCGISFAVPIAFSPQVDNLLAVGDGALVVGAPCSGLRSLLALGTVAMVLAGVSEAPLGRRGVLICAALPVALGTNWMRLTSIVVASGALGTARSVALLDGPAGLVFFLAAVALLVALGRLIGCRVVLAG